MSRAGISDYLRGYIDRGTCCRNILAAQAAAKHFVQPGKRRSGAPLFLALILLGVLVPPRLGIVSGFLEFLGRYFSGFVGFDRDFMCGLP